MSARRLLAVLILSTCVRCAPACAAIKVVATIFPLADVVRQIGKEHVEVTVLLPPGANPHTFEPTPAQIRDVSGARLFVCVGAGLDAWATKLLAARSAPIVTVTFADGIPLLASALTASSGEHVEHGGDPHVWVDPILVRDRLVPAIVAALAAEEPAAAAAFEAGGAELREELTTLDGEIRRTLTPLSNRGFIAFHSAWRYFARRYDLREVAVVEPFPGKEPSAREIAGVVEAARAGHAGVMLVEPQFNSRVAQQIARECDAKVLALDPIGGPAVEGRAHYLDLMRYNARVLAEALR